MAMLKKLMKKLKKTLHKLVDFCVTFKPIFDFVKIIQDVIKNFK